jgi:hypothetical protein
MHMWIAARSLQLVLIDHDHRFIERFVQLVLVERCSHRVSVPQYHGPTYRVVAPGVRATSEKVERTVRCANPVIVQAPLLSLA